MTGQIMLAGGSVKQDPQGRKSVVFREPAEAETMRRWQARQFEEIERRHARQWRSMLSGIDFDAKVNWVRNLVSPDRKIASLADASAFANAFIGTAGREVLTFAGQFLEIPDDVWPAVERRFAEAGRPPLKEFAPYAAFVLTIDIVFYLGMRIGQISAQRPSNIVDASYLYYLPFCMVFASGDNLHARLAPLFLRPNQRFVRAADLKAGLKQLNEYYTQHVEEIEKVGVMGYAPEPPAEPHTIVTDLWDQCLPGRRRSKEQPDAPPNAPTDADLLKRFEQIVAAAEHTPEADWDGEADSVVLRHEVPLRRGRWRLVPEGVENRSQS